MKSFKNSLLKTNQLNVALKTDIKYFLMTLLNKIFGRYMPHEGGLDKNVICFHLFTGWGQRDFHKQPDNPCSETDKSRNTYSLDDDKLHEVEVSIIE